VTNSVRRLLKIRNSARPETVSANAKKFVGNLGIGIMTGQDAGRDSPLGGRCQAFGCLLIFWFSRLQLLHNDCRRIASLTIDNDCQINLAGAL
jgi:hypothetical protein